MDMRRKLLRSWLGRKVHIVIDRPIGHKHKNTVYPINYGYVPGELGGDGEPLDAYLIGVDHPVTEFDGWVVGTVRRFDNVEDKLVVAPEGMRFHQGEITKAVWFQERWFKTAVDAVLRKSCGVVPFRRNPEGELEVLLRESGYPPKSVSRNGNFVTYFKQSDQIEDFLTLIGAPVAAMKIMSTKMEKDLRNSVNRRLNCDNANLDKAVEAAAEQTSIMISVLLALGPALRG